MAYVVRKVKVEEEVLGMEGEMKEQKHHIEFDVLWNWFEWKVVKGSEEESGMKKMKKKKEMEMEMEKSMRLEIN